MAKKEKVEGVKPQAGAEKKGSDQNREEKKTQEKTAPKSSFETTDGHVMDTVKLFPKNNLVYVQAHYGKLNPSGKTSEEKRAGMQRLLARPLSPEQKAEYQRLHAENPTAAKEYALKAAYPMHMDGKKFNETVGEVNGHAVDYIVINKLTARDLLNETQQKEYDTLAATDKKAAEEFAMKTIPAKNHGLIGKWQLTSGIKGDKDSRFVGIMTSEEAAANRHRAVVTLDDKGQVKTIGAPVSKLMLAAMVEQRSLAQRQVASEKLDAANKVDWTKYKFADGVEVKGLNYAPSKDPDRVWLRGKVDGIDVSGLLSKNETTALRNKLAPLENLAAANKHFREQVMAIVGGEKAKGVSEAEAVKVVIDRASDKSAKAFTPDQVKILNAYAGDSQDKGGVFVSLFEKAKPELDKAGVNAKWQEDTKAELTDLAAGKVREQSQGMHR